MHTHTHTHTGTHAHAHTHTGTHAHTYTHTHTQAPMHTHTHTQAPMHTHTHTGTHAHTHTHIQEAALYVREGEDNAKFYHHPRGKWSKMAFKILHHPFYYICHLVVSVLLMLLAFIEDPRIGNSELSESHKKAILSVSHN